MATEQKHRPDESKGCCCGTGGTTGEEAQPQKRQTDRHEDHPTEPAQKPAPSRSKGCCGGS